LHSHRDKLFNEKLFLGVAGAAAAYIVIRASKLRK
jgi:hypothetical protein